MKNIEILAPAGDSSCFLSAIAAGATAIYFGIGSFNARVRAVNIQQKELSSLVSIAKFYNVRTYLTLNILIKDDEFIQAIDLVEFATNCGIDAIIVQDIGLLYILKKLFKNIEIHCSTQFTTHNIWQCDFLSNYDVSQINLSRELSLDELKNINFFLKKRNIKSEVFVHGAFCISYSGQCYLSNALYNQAGNRGECVQPCRRCYSTTNQNNITPFNLKDNHCYDILDKIIKSDCDSLKIEGRIKDSNYVYSVVSAYKQQLQNIKENKKIHNQSNLLNYSMNRDFTNGYMIGKISKSMFHFGKKNEATKYVGIVKNYFAKENKLTIKIDNNESIQIKDKLFILDQYDKFVCTFEIEKKLSAIEYTIKITNKLISKILPGQKIYKELQGVSDLFLKEQIEEIKKKYNKNKTQLNIQDTNKIEVSVFVEYDLSLNKIKFEFCTNKSSICVFSKNNVQIAKINGLTKEIIFEKLGKLGTTKYFLKNVFLKNDISKFYLSLSELNEIRKEAIELLNKSQSIKSYSQKFIDLKNDITKNYITTEQIKYIDIDVFEVPNILQNNLLDISKKINNQKLVPYFPAIMFDNDIQKHFELLKLLKDKTIICDNIGFAYYASKLNFKIILGQRTNIYNSFSLIAYLKNINVCGIVPNFELSKIEFNKLLLNKDINIYNFKNYKTPLLQSRQCLLKNLTKCNKELCDENCILTCEKTQKFVGQQGERLIAKKIKGFYSSVYLDEAYNEK